MQEFKSLIDFGAITDVTLISAIINNPELLKTLNIKDYTTYTDNSIEVTKEESVEEVTKKEPTTVKEEVTKEEPVTEKEQEIEVENKETTKSKSK